MLAQHRTSRRSRKRRAECSKREREMAGAEDESGDDP
jgi:hypothetical protein